MIVRNNGRYLSVESDGFVIATLMWSNGAYVDTITGERFFTRDAVTRHFTLAMMA